MALNFPTDNLVAGVTTFDLGGTNYLWDGVRWRPLITGAGGASGHVIENATGDDLTQRDNLQFTNTGSIFSVTDDATNNRTIVNYPAGASGPYVQYESQDLTDPQQAQARTNIGAAGTTVASTTTSGLLSSVDWNTFNNKQDAITADNAGTIRTTLNVADGADVTPDWVPEVNPNYLTSIPTDVLRDADITITDGEATSVNINGINVPFRAAEDAFIAEFNASTAYIIGQNYTSGDKLYSISNAGTYATAAAAIINSTEILRWYYRFWWDGSRCCLVHGSSVNDTSADPSTD